MMEAVRTSEMSVNNHFTRQYNPEDSSERYKFVSEVGFMMEATLQLILEQYEKLRKHVRGISDCRNQDIVLGLPERKPSRQYVLQVMSG
jgi:hypothetical protein